MATSKKKKASKVVKPAKKPAKPAGDEHEAAAALLLEQYEAGEIDNAWDVIDEVADLAERLSKKSPVWKPFKQMFDELADLCQGDE